MSRTITIAICEETYYFIEALRSVGVNLKENGTTISCSFSVNGTSSVASFGELTEESFQNEDIGSVDASFLQTLQELERKGFVVMSSDTNKDDDIHNLKTDSDYAEEDDIYNRLENLFEDATNDSDRLLAEHCLRNFCFLSLEQIKQTVPAVCI